mmetsp:Transcript_20205/g.44092  ORF Transcript_20205/g.44092 Transcript_20205/m.44092 type:complete len:1358 (-) Transcript_20205:104-4177(-)
MLVLRKAACKGVVKDCLQTVLSPTMLRIAVVVIAVSWSLSEARRDTSFGGGLALFPDVDIDAFGGLLEIKAADSLAGTLAHRGNPEVNHISRSKMSAEEHLLGGAVASMLISIIVAVSGVLYLLHYPDPQIKNYTVKLVTLAFSIYCAVMLEKIQLNYAKGDALMPFIHQYVKKDTTAASFLELGICVLLFTFWFFLISYLSYYWRSSKENLFAVQQFVAHEAAFVAIHCFGYFEKHIVGYQLTNVDEWADYLTFALFPVGVHFFCGVLQLGTHAFRNWLENSQRTSSASTPEQDAGHHVAESQLNAQAAAQGPHGHNSHSHDEEHGHGHGHGSHWQHSAHEGESDAMALVESFLIRQAMLFFVTHRVPSLKGDKKEKHPMDFLMLFLAITVVMIVLFLLHKVRKEVYRNGQEGLLENTLHYEQMLGCMILAWSALTVGQWIVQGWCLHLAFWTFGAAILVTPFSCVVLVMTDWLVDRQLLDEVLGLSMINSCGFMIGFAWEVAFAAAVDTIAQQVHQWSSFWNIALCAWIMIMVMPAWRYIMLPQAIIPVPARTGPKGFAGLSQLLADESNESSNNNNSNSNSSNSNSNSNNNSSTSSSNSSIGRVDVPRAWLAHFEQPCIHLSAEAAAKILGFPGEKELKRFAGPLLKKSDEEPLGSFVGPLLFKRLVVLASSKTAQAGKMMEELLLGRDFISLPSQPLPAKGAVGRWPTAIPDEVGMDKLPFDRLRNYFEWRTRMRHFAGITCGIVKNGHLVYYQESGYANVETKTKMATDSIVRLFSMTKCLVSAAFMTYYEEPQRGIDLDDPVSKYLPAFAQSSMSVLPKRGQRENQPLDRPITLRQLLTHTSGIGYGATLDDPWPPQKGSYYKIYEDICEETKDGRIKNLEQWCNALAKIPLKGQPGQMWDYSYSLDVLGRVLEVIANKPLDVIMEERLTGPLKMRDTGFVVPKDQAHRIGPWYKSVEVEGKPNVAHQLEVVDKGGEASGWVGANASSVLSAGGTLEVPLAMKGGMVSTFNDYLRFLIMLRNYGELDGVRVLKRETVQLMIANHIPAACNGKKTVFVFDKPGVGYNLLGQIQSSHPKQDKGTVSGEYGWGGLAGPAFTIDPRADIIVLSMTQTAFVLDHEEYLRYAGRRAIHQYFYGSVAAPNKATSYPPEVFEALKPKPGDNGKESDKEFEEEYRTARLTRSKTAKERAILPGARLDRHPSDDADVAMGSLEGAASAPAEDGEGTPVAKRRKSVVQVPKATLSTSPVAQQTPTRPPDPSKPQEYMFRRVTVPGEAPSQGPEAPTPSAQKARVTGHDGEMLEVITEGNWQRQQVHVKDLSLIDESHFGSASLVANAPKEFPMPGSQSKDKA